MPNYEDFSLRCYLVAPLAIVFLTACITVGCCRKIGPRPAFVNRAGETRDGCPRWSGPELFSDSSGNRFCCDVESNCVLVLDAKLFEGGSELHVSSSETSIAIVSGTDIHKIASWTKDSHDKTYWLLEIEEPRIYDCEPGLSRQIYNRALSLQVNRNSLIQNIKHETRLSQDE